MARVFLQLLFSLLLRQGKLVRVTEAITALRAWQLALENHTADPLQSRGMGASLGGWGVLSVMVLCHPGCSAAAADVQTTLAESAGWAVGFLQPLVGSGDTCGSLKGSTGSSDLTVPWSFPQLCTVCVSVSKALNVDLGLSF